MNKYLDLFLTFARIGGLTFGGGYAMLPMLQKEVVEKRGWATEEELMDYYALGQCTPGIIAVNTATFGGHKVKGTWGSIIATLGVVAPSIVIITVIAMVLENFMDIVWVQNAFAGIRVAVCALITASVVKLFKTNVKKHWHIALAVAAFVVVALLKLSPVYVVVACAVLSFIFGKKEAKA